MGNDLKSPLGQSFSLEELVKNADSRSVGLTRGPRFCIFTVVPGETRDVHSSSMDHTLNREDLRHHTHSLDANEDQRVDVV